jgi:glycosyltransferase involved in cell wall biosynthesis
MARPAVSVIIPTFNRAALALQAVQSVLAQTFSDYEVIVVDDGSSDETKEVLAAFAKLPGFQYHYQPNSGRSAARNHGIELARGEFVMFLDSDDMLFPDALAILYEAAQHTTAGMILGQVQLVNERQGKLSLLEPTANARSGGFNYPALIRERYFLFQGSFLLRAACLHEIGGFDRTLEPCEDYDFCLRAVLAGRVVYVETPVLQCRIHGGNTDPMEIYRGGLKVARKHLRLINEDGALPDTLRRVSRVNWMLRVADNNYGLRRNREALKHYLRALMLRPAIVFDLKIDKQILASLVPAATRERLKAALPSSRRIPHTREPNDLS